MCVGGCLHSVSAPHGAYFKKTVVPTQVPATKFCTACHDGEWAAAEDEVRVGYDPARGVLLQ